MEVINLNKEKIDIGFGRLILEHYKIRRRLGLLSHKNFSRIDLICSKYQEKYLEHAENLCPELNEENDNNLIGEFERVLQELQRREELIHELLTKIEKYESSPKESISFSTNALSNLSKSSLEYVQASQHIEPKDSDVVRNHEGKSLLLWKSILNEMINYNYSRNLDCPNIKQNNSSNIKCKHEQLTNLYKNKLILLYEELEKLKTGSKSNQ